jgi:MFS family permease
MAPIIEGLLGGFSSIQSATSSYVGDCTTPGSRAKIFSRFTGAFYIGSAIGPIIADFFIQHPIVVFGRRFPFSYGNVDTSVFWVAIAFSAVNFYMALFVFPESLGKKKREKAIQEYNKTGGISKSKAKKPLHSPIDGLVSEISGIEEQENEEVRMANVTENTTSSTGLKGGFIMRLLSPLSILLPVIVVNPSGIVRKKRDWTLTLLAVGLISYMLSTVIPFGY